jgi:hypothetical protein
MKEKEFKQSEDQEEKKVGKEFKKISPSSEVILMFKQNRKFELRIGRNYFTFFGREKIKVNRSIIEHPDFTPAIKKYFVVQEVK